MSFVLPIFLSAWLLFVIQLMLGKFLLPWFGGTPAVWTTCVLFFQILLLGGYVYAHLLSAHLAPRTQVKVHVGLLGVSVLLLGGLLWNWGSPVLPPDAWKPGSAVAPVWQILKVLAASVGFPFVLLSATSPLLQHWSTMTSGGKDPYRLYALSNAGSMIGLLSYPFLVEPLLRLSTQGRVWGFLYTLFAAASAGCAVKVLRVDKAPVTSAPARIDNESPPARHTVVLWLLLTTLTAAMFLSVTNLLCQDLAVVPFLWVVPLIIYLLTFIITFAGERWYHRGAFFVATAIATFCVLSVAAESLRFNVPTQIAILSIFLFLFCMTGHGELVRLRPGPRHLTWFYLMIALGGVLGGGFVAVVAPLVFKGYWELHVTLTAGWLVFAILLVKEKGSAFYRGDRWQFAGLILAGSYAMARVGLGFTSLKHWDSYWKNTTAFTVAAAACVAWLVLKLCRRGTFAESAWWPRLVVGGMFLASGCSLLQRMRTEGMNTVEVRRNFYGVVRVRQTQAQMDGRIVPMLQLTHGRINHGIQYEDDALRRQPTAYYSKGSGIELAIRLHSRRINFAPLNLGVLGLGTGTLAAFVGKADAARFYEINPAVIALAAGPQARFAYLQDCEGRVEIVPGDARLGLERALAAGVSGEFDILALDVFSGDSIPVHLLTREAFEIYAEHLRDDRGILAVNISNHHLDLRDLIVRLARHCGMEAVIINSAGGLPDRTPSCWCLLTKDSEFIRLPEIQERRQDYQVGREVLWTDDFSNLFQLLR